MGKAAKFFRGLFGLKKDHSPSQSAAKPPKRRWSFVKSCRERDRTPTKNTITDDAVDPSKHAITAAEKITSSGRSNATTATSAAYVSEWAVITIQAHFRGHQARRALRALKGLVKLQALVRGHIVRKQTVELAQILQAMYRAQARACARRAQISESPHSSNKSSQFQARRALRALKGLVKLQALVRGHIVRKRTVELAQILQAMYRAQARACARRAQISESPHSSNKSSQFQARRELRASKGLVKLQALVRGHIVRKLTVDVVQRLQAWLQAQARACAGRTQISESPHSSNKSSQFQGPATPVKFERAISSKIAKHDQSPMLLNGPQFYSASSRSGSPKRGPFTPSKSDGSRSNLSCHYPNCMACTESSRPKVRSLSAPKRRPQFESSVSSKRYSVHGYGESRSSSLRVSTNFANKAYLGSSRLERLGMPLRGEVHSLCPLMSMQGNTEESPFCTANNGPQFYSASSRSGSPKRGPFTPSKSDESRSNLSCHYPNCMACTESSRPKVRSLSAPNKGPNLRALFHPKGTQFMGMVSPDQSLSGIWSFGEAWNACDRRCNLAQCWPLEQILE
ncbi:uncharacterized protein LOC114307289 [Camellia sinensis]|uniref:uncharacterized protein LOC114307289 n=1 Tax=Camellia sinensis TaxID=4442 RepID=UPI001036969F|nr:uncharacterized protein LOC114307289 [Camellia sinensis]